MVCGPVKKRKVIEECGIKSTSLSRKKTREGTYKIFCSVPNQHFLLTKIVENSTDGIFSAPVSQVDKIKVRTGTHQHK